jgi:hypothetical protein
MGLYSGRLGQLCPELGHGLTWALGMIISPTLPIIEKFSFFLFFMGRFVPVEN